jgi:hypothetical protein
VLVLAGFLAVLSFVKLSSTDLGYAAEGLYSVRVTDASLQQSPPGRFAWQRQVLDELRSLPTVAGATAVDIAPVLGEAPRMVQDAEGRRVAIRQVMDEYLNVMQTKVLAGRAFTDAEVRTASPTAVLSRSAVALLFPDASPETTLNRILTLAGEPERRVVGIVADTRSRQASPVVPEILVPASADTGRPLEFLARAKPGLRLDPTSMRSVLQREFGPSLAVTTAAASDFVEPFLQNPRLYSEVFGVFAIVALLLSAVGLFAVTAFDTSLRRYEMGIRMTLGADARDIQRLVIKDAVKPVAIGILVGSVAALWAARFFQALLFEVDSRDPRVYALVTSVLLAASIVAAWWPAHRAGKVDPAIVLRSQ